MNQQEHRNLPEKQATVANVDKEVLHALIGNVRGAFQDAADHAYSPSSEPYTVASRRFYKALDGLTKVVDIIGVAHQETVAQSDPSGRFNDDQVAALHGLKAAFERATDVGLFDELLADCKSPDSFNDVCDAVQEEVDRLSVKPSAAPTFSSPSM